MGRITCIFDIRHVLAYFLAGQEYDVQFRE